MMHNIMQIIYWLQFARDYTNELPDFNDPDHTVKGIQVHLDAAISALKALRGIGPGEERTMVQGGKS
jgi:hypothetical protein